MSNKRGSRGKSCSKCKFAVQLNVRNEEQLQRTLDLRGVKGNKPCINDVILRIVERLDAEEREEMLEMARSWQRGSSWSKNMLYNCMGEDICPCYDDDVYYGPYDEIYDDLYSKDSRRLKKLNKKLFRRENGKKKKGSKRYDYGYGSEDDYWSNRHTMFSDDEWSDEDDDSYKCIKFYSDIENELSVREFNSLKEFDDFCQENGYHLSATDYNNLVDWSVVHCCLDPISEEYGEHDIITDNSYGALYWTVSDDITKDKSNSLVISSD